MNTTRALERGVVKVDVNESNPGACGLKVDAGAGRAARGNNERDCLIALLVERADGILALLIRYRGAEIACTNVEELGREGGEVQSRRPVGEGDELYPSVDNHFFDVPNDLLDVVGLANEPDSWPVRASGCKTGHFVIDSVIDGFETSVMFIIVPMFSMLARYWLQKGWFRFYILGKYSYRVVLDTRLAIAILEIGGGTRAGGQMRCPSVEVEVVLN